MSDTPPSAPAVARNRAAILSVLTNELRDRKRVLEIGSGTGEHAIYFAPRLDWLVWQTSDRLDNHEAILAWLEREPSANLPAPLLLDVNSPPELDRDYDAVFSANTAHIMSAQEVRKMFAFVGELLPSGGKFCLYGPFNQNGEFTSESNARFDASLKAQNPDMGIRDIAALDELGAVLGLTRREFYEMPANNNLAIWIRE